MTARWIPGARSTNARAGQPTSAVARVSRVVHRLSTERDEARSEARYYRALLVRAKFNITDPDLRNEIEEALKESA